MTEARTTGQHDRRAGRATGFTLLEVMIALTITSMVMGGLFTLAAGSKRLAASAQDNLFEALQLRATIQFAQLDEQLRDIEPLQGGGPESFSIEAGALLPDPIRRTMPMQTLLQEYQVYDEDGEPLVSGSRWVLLDVPR